MENGRSSMLCNVTIQIERPHIYIIYNYIIYYILTFLPDILKISIFNVTYIFKKTGKWDSVINLFFFIQLTSV